MSDVFSSEMRSLIMSKIKSKNSKQEIIIRKIIWNLGFRYRLHVKDLPGKPDIVFKNKNKVIFINGCFWHGHENCKKNTIPKTNRLFWQNKIDANIKRDKANYERLLSMGWKILIIWTCEIKIKNMEKLKSNINDFLMLS